MPRAQHAITPRGNTPGRGVLLCLLLLLALSGCSSTGERDTTTDDLYNQGTRAAQEAQGLYTFGHGTGANRAEARQAARDELAEAVLVFVRSEAELTQREGPEPAITREFTSSAFSWANVELRNVEVAAEERASDGWYVRLRIDQSTMHELTAEARENVPALSKAYTLNNVPDDQPARRLRRALEGLALIQGSSREGVLGLAERERPDISDRSFLTAEGSSQTFGSYFRGAVEQAVQQMRLLPIADTDTNQLYFVLLDRDTHRPQGGTVISVNGQELETNSQGETRSLAFSDLGETLNLAIPGYSQALYSANWVHPEPALYQAGRYRLAELTRQAETQVFFYTVPSDANIRLDGESLGAPERHRLASGARYQLEARSEQHRDQQQELSISRGAAYALVRFELVERQFGQLDLSVRDRRASLSVQRDRQTPVRTEGNSFSREVEAGSYAIRVGRGASGDFDENYQIITEQFELQQDDTVERDYPAPRYRQPYHQGWRVGYYAGRSGGEFQSDFRLPWLEGQSVGYGDISAQPGMRGVSFEQAAEEEFSLSAQRYFNFLNLTAQAQLGNRRQKLQLVRDNGQRVSTQTSGYVAAAGAGFWLSTHSDSLVSSVTFNHAFETAQWHSDHRFQVLDNQGNAQWIDGSTKANNYSFIEVNSHLSLGGGFGLTLSVQAPLDGLEPLIQLGVGYTMMASGYRRPAMVRYADLSEEERR